MVAMQSDVRNSRLHVVPDCLQHIIILEQIGPLILLLSHGYCLVKNSKSIRELVMLRNKNWKTGLFT